MTTDAAVNNDDRRGRDTGGAQVDEKKLSSKRLKGRAEQSNNAMVYDEAGGGQDQGGMIFVSRLHFVATHTSAQYKQL